MKNNTVRISLMLSISVLIVCLYCCHTSSAQRIILAKSKDWDSDEMESSRSRRSRSSTTPSLEEFTSMIDSMSEDDVARFVVSELGFSEKQAKALKSQSVDGPAILDIIGKHIATGLGSSGSKWECHEQSTLGLSSYCEYHRAVCLGPDFKFIVIDDTKPPGSPLPQYHVADKHPRNEMEIGQVLIARKGVSAGTPFRSFVDGFYMPREFLDREDISWVNGLSFLVNRDDACSQNIFHVASAALTGWYYLLHGHDWGTDKFDWVHANCTAFKHIVTFCAEEELPQFAREYFHAAIGSEECTKLWTEQSLKKLKHPQICFEHAIVPGHDAALFHGPEDAQKFRDRMWFRANVTYHPGPIPFNARWLRRRWGPISPVRGAMNQQQISDLLFELAGVHAQPLEFEGLSLIEQVREMATCSLLFATHGAGLANAVFMPPGGVVFELNPAVFAHEMFHYVAINSGHWYFRYNAAFNETKFDDNFFTLKKRYHHFNLRACMDSFCIGITKHSNFTVSVDRFRPILQQALDLLCYEIPCEYVEDKNSCNYHGRYSSCRNVTTPYPLPLPKIIPQQSIP